MKFRNPFPKSKRFTIKINGVPIRFYLMGNEEINLNQFGVTGNDNNTANNLVNGNRVKLLLDAHQDSMIEKIAKKEENHKLETPFVFGNVLSNCDCLQNQYSIESWRIIMVPSGKKGMALNTQFDICGDITAFLANNSMFIIKSTGGTVVFNGIFSITLYDAELDITSVNISGSILVVEGTKLCLGLASCEDFGYYSFTDLIINNGITTINTINPIDVSFQLNSIIRFYDFNSLLCETTLFNIENLENNLVKLTFNEELSISENNCMQYIGVQANIHFFVTDEAMNPIVGATINIRVNSRGVRSFVTDINGELLTNIYYPGSDNLLLANTLYSYTIRADGYTELSGEITTSVDGSEVVVSSALSIYIAPTTITFIKNALQMVELAAFTSVFVTCNGTTVEMLINSFMNSGSVQFVVEPDIIYSYTATREGYVTIENTVLSIANTDVPVVLSFEIA